MLTPKATTNFPLTADLCMDLIALYRSNEIQNEFQAKPVFQNNVCYQFSFQVNFQQLSSGTINACLCGAMRFIRLPPSFQVLLINPKKLSDPANIYAMAKPIMNRKLVVLTYNGSELNSTIQNVVHLVVRSELYSIIYRKNKA